MLRRLTLAGLVVLLAAAVPAQGRSSAKTLVLNFNITQEATLRHDHPPPGENGVYLSTTLLLNNQSPQLGKGAGAHVGSISFRYVINGTCGATGGAGCQGTTDIWTVSNLPGGTITAASKKVSLGARPFVVAIQSGTGAFKGATGKVEIAAKGAAVTTIVVTTP